jgi:superfamily I DNA/RNA helicase
MIVENYVSRAEIVTWQEALIANTKQAQEKDRSYVVRIGRKEDTKDVIRIVHLILARVNFASDRQ